GRVPVLLAARSLTALPEVLRTLYDSGDLTEVPIGPLGDDAADEFATAVTGGALTPDARVRIRSTAAGVPLRIREIITGSKAAGRLVPTDLGWELRGDPSPSPRLAQLTAERFDALDPEGLD